MQQPPVPIARDLLPPLLACLPTTFLSAQPPPALLPLLAPTLRQRVNFLSSNGANSRDGWVRLLSWDAQEAAKLPTIVENLQLEPHPVSGEVEIDDVRTIKYRRLDDETLHARLEVDQFGLLPIYVWCENDEHGETGPGWKLTELKSMDDISDGAQWFDVASDANESYTQHAQRQPTPAQPRRFSKDDGDDEDYWASYDRESGQTPGMEQQNRSRKQSAVPGGDDEYYARYGEEVQPAMDAHDPDEAAVDGEGTLLGTQERGRLTATLLSVPTEDDRPAWQKALYPHKPSAPHDSAVANSLAHSTHSELGMPRPISPASSSRSVERLEEQAAAMSDTSADSRVEHGIKQHISTDIKSLFRLAKTTGMSRRAFESLIKRELDMLSMLDDDE